MTLAYVALEMNSRSVRRQSWMRDIYPFAISSYEVFSDNLSAWKLVLPFLNDTILIDALRNEERPDLKYLFLDSFAVTPIETLKDVFSVISESWNIDADS